MKLSGGAITKGKVAAGCLLLLGFTSGVGLACTEINENTASNAFNKMGEWIFDFFKGEENSTSPSLTQPIDPISPITQTWGHVSSATQTIFSTVSSSYTWLSESENSKWVVNFLKNFWNFDFVKGLVFNFHLTVKAWLRIWTDSTVLSNFPDAFKTFKVLASSLSQASEDKDILNWLYLRFVINPRRMITILKRGQRSDRKQKIEEVSHLKCNGRPGKKPKKVKGENLPLGTCFICKDSNKLIQEMIDFLREGKIPEPSTEKQ